MHCSLKNSLHALPVLLLLAAYAGAAFSAAGNVQFVMGDVKLINRAGETRALQKGAEINEGDRIITAAGASAQIKMVDGGFIAIRPNTDMAFDTYRYSGKEDGTENAVVSLLQGGFRTITGLIGRTNKQNYLVRTVTATIGIRGTDHEPMVILSPPPGQVAIGEPGTYDKVNLGIAYISNDAGSVDIHRNQVGFAPESRTTPLLLPKIPPFYKPTPPLGPQKATEEVKDEIRNTSFLDPSSSVATGSAATSAGAAPASLTPPAGAGPASLAPAVPITLTGTLGATVNLTTQTVTTPGGITVPITPPNSGPAFAAQAQAAADAAAVSASALNTLLTSTSTADPTAVSTTAPSAVSAAQPAVTSASSAGTTIAALTINTGLAASNAAAAAALATTATSQVSTATSKFNANGTFADATAAPALAALNAANAVLQTANGGVQSAAGSVTVQNSTLTATQSAASTALNTANQALNAANAALSALTAAGVPSSTTASSLLSAAQSAATAAQAAATQASTLQGAGDSTGAQAQLAIAQQQAQIAASALRIAGQILTAVVSANAARLTGDLITADSTAGLLSAATSAQSTGASAVNTTSAQLAAAQAQAQTVQQNSVLAQYNNPAVASGNFTEHFSGLKAVPGGVEHAIDGPSTPSANTNSVLDGNKSLVEIRNIGYERSGSNYSAAVIQNADITFSGGTAKDLASDPNGVFYFGRWQGGQINVRDRATTEAVAPFSDALGPASALWFVGLVPGNSALTAAGNPINNTQKIVGTANYSLASATHPTDSLGNVGTLNSATLAANFSAQTVNAAVDLSFSTADPVNVSTRNLNISATANNVPIQGPGFEAKNAPGTVVNCTGACAGGYVGSIAGTFLSTASAGSTTGGVGTGAALFYGFGSSIVSAPGNQPFTDFIQGLAVLGTSTAPTVGVTNFSNTSILRDEMLWPTTQVLPVNPTTTTYRVSDKPTENLVNNLPGTPARLTGPANNTNFLFDANGNLVRVFDTPHVVFDHGTDVLGSSTQFAAPTPLAHAQLSFGGGGATSESYFDPGTQVRFGRWTGGVVNVTDLTTGNSFVESLVAPGGGNRSVQWLVAQTPSSLPTTGVFQYTRINDASGTPSFATAPADSYGNVGTLQGARLSADFVNNTVSAGVRISMPSGPAGSLGTQNLSSFFQDAPISGGGFNVSSSPAQNPAGTDNLHVGCFGNGCAPNQNYGGRIRGAFDSATGNAGTADGAFFRYTFNTNYAALGAGPVPAGRVVDDYIDGLVAFQQGPQIVLPTAASGVYSLTAPTAPVTALTTYSYNNAGNVFTSNERNWVDRPSAINPATGSPFLVTDTSGNLVSITDDNNQHGNGNAITLSGGTPNPSAPVSLAIGSTATATDGTILLGWQRPTGTTPLTVSGNDFNGCFGTTGCVNPARSVLADGLAWVRGPAPFPDYLPGAIAGFSNSAGVVVPGTATYNLGASVLHDQNGVAGAVNSATLGVDFTHASVNFGMTATTGAGNWAANANGIRLHDQGSFNAFTPGGTITTNPTIPDTHDNLTVTLTTAAAGTTAASGNIQGQLMGIGLGGAGVAYNLNSILGSPVSASGALAFGLSAGQQPYSTTTAYQIMAFTTGMSAAGQFDSTENNGIRGGIVSPFRTQTINDFPVKVDGEFAVVQTQTQPPPCVTGCTNVNVNSIPVVFAVPGATGAASVGTAALLESGIDAATGIRWGRYGNGTVGISDRISGASLGTVDLTRQNSHFILTSVQSGPTVLPLSGTFNYTFAGGTSPTDSNGNVGSPLTSANASLTANFTTQTVNATLSNLVVGGNTWGASATSIPIVGNIFQAEQKLGGGGNLAVTFNGTTGASNAGQLAGAFTGAKGNGVGMLYSLNHGGNIATNPAAAITVSGVAAFRRP